MKTQPDKEHEFNPRKGDQIGVSYCMEGRAHYDDALYEANAEESYRERSLQQLGYAYAKVNAKESSSFFLSYKEEIHTFETRDQAEFFCMKAKPPIDFGNITKRVELTLG